MRRTRLVLAVAIACCAVPAGAALEACSVPVFRYALERWPAARYQVIVVRRGPLDEARKGIVDWLWERGESTEVWSNTELHTLDLSTDAGAAAFESLKEPLAGALPRLILRYPAAYMSEGNIWSGPLTAENARALVDSAVRRKIGTHLLEGDAAVWVLLESGDGAKDDAAARTLHTELSKLEKTLKLPTLLDEDILGGAAGAGELKVGFSVVRLSRNDPAETVLVEQLLQSERGLRDFTEPIVFPVFGQGRALCALGGKGINAGNVRDIAEFLSGPCSCIVKDQNPGTDLLMSVNWDQIAEGRWVKPPEMPPLTGISDFAPAQGTGGDTEATSGASGTARLWVHSWLVLGGLAALALLGVVVVAATVILRRRNRLTEG